MNPRIRAAAATTVALVALTMFGTPASASSAEDWGKSYCKTGPKVTDAVKATTEHESDLVDAIQSGTGDVAAIIDAYDADLSRAQKMATKTAKALKKVGAPDIKNGAKLQRAAIKAYKTTAKELGNARDALADIDTANPAASADPLLALGSALGDAASALNNFAFDVLSPTVRKNADLARVIVDKC